jgi:hypothetical protein
MLARKRAEKLAAQWSPVVDSVNLLIKRIRRLKYDYADCDAWVDKALPVAEHIRDVVWEKRKGPNVDGAQNWRDAVGYSVRMQAWDVALSYPKRGTCPFARRD